MVKFQGRAKHLIYMKNKPIKWGFKMYVLCDSINGYCLNILHYIGEKKFIINYIISILSSKLNTNDFLYMDRHYTSIELFLLLKEKGINATGTVKSNWKNLPKELIKNLKLN